YLLGYNYSFKVLDTPEINAFACPCGKIFVTSGLLDIIESDYELEAILAHEIAHVENRHAIKQYFDSQKAGSIIDIVGIATSIIVYEATDNPYLSLSMSEIALSISDLVSKLVLYDYNREYEDEADMYTKIYIDHNNILNGDLHFINILKKLKFLINIKDLDENTSLFSSHPNIDYRINKIYSYRIRKFEPPINFIGYNNLGDKLLQINIEKVITCFIENNENIFIQASINSYPASYMTKVTTKDKYYIRRKTFSNSRFGINNLVLKTEAGSVKLSGFFNWVLIGNANIRMFFQKRDILIYSSEYSRELINNPKIINAVKKGDFDVKIDGLEEIKKWERIDNKK
ncbi:MAG: M48 family metalloprotease, partial [Promethearchaeota archaeon]